MSRRPPSLFAFRRSFMARQRGVAIITALLLTTLAITIVASLFWQQQVQVRSIENQRLQLQKQWILRGALDWARLILREDAKFSNVDNLDEPWAVSLAETRLDQYVENGRAAGELSDATLSGDIVDAQSRYNLTNLCPDGAINRDEVAVFSRLLGYLRLDPALAQATADLMARSRARPDPGQPAQPANRSRPMALTQLDDLLAVPGFSPEAVAKLREYAILLPRATPLNINTASAEALSARIDTLSLADAAAVVTLRKTASFRDQSDVKSRVPGKLDEANPNEISVSTSFFIVRGKVRMSRAVSEVQALVERNGANTKVIWIREH